MLCVAENKQINQKSHSEAIKNDLKILALAKDNTHHTTTQWDVSIWLEKLSECLKTNPPA